MANKWNYNLNSRKDMEINENKIPKPDLSSSVVHVTQKNVFQRFGAKLKSFNIREFFKLNLKYALFLLPLIAALVLVNKLQQKQSLDSTAGVGQAKLFFQSDKVTLPPDTELQLLGNSDGPVGFVRTEITFNPNIAKLQSEIDVTASPFKRVVKLTSMIDANITGKIEIVLGLDPSNLATPPTGNFQIAKFRLGSNTSTINATTSLTFNTSNTQIVNTNLTVFNISTINTSVVANYVEPTASPTAESSATPTATTISSTSTPGPTENPACNSCHKRRCDSTCTNKDGLGCPDCI